MGDDKGMGCIVIVFSVMSLIGGACVGSMIGQQAIRQQAIDHGYAKHDEKTGVWMWIENKQLTKEPDHE